MRLIRRAIHMGAVWLLLSVCLWAAGSACLNNAVPASGVSRFSMRFSPRNEPSFNGIEQYYDEKASRAAKTVIPGLVTAWAEERNRQVSATEWQADAAVDIYYINGNIMDVMDLVLVAGGFPASTDKTGISIDSKTAVKLFGSSAPVGLNITLGGQKYSICGIFEYPKGITLLGADTGRGLAVLSPPPALSSGASDGKTSNKVGVQGVEFIFPAGLSPDEAKSYAVQLAGEMGLGGAVYSKDYSAGDKMLRQLAQFPGWVMMAVAILMLLYTAYSQARMMQRMAWRRFRSRSISGAIALNTALRGALWGGVILLASACVFLIVRPDFSLPPSYIPTQWSDVGFWPELIKKMMIDQAERNALPIARPDAMTNALTCWGCAFIAASLVSICFFNTCLGKVLGRPVSKRLRHYPDEWPHPAAHLDTSCYLLLLLSAAAPVLGLKLAELLGLRPVISGTALTTLLIPAVMVSIELILRLWPSTLWPLRFSPISELLLLTRRIQGIHILGKNVSKTSGLHTPEKNKTLKE
jgi:hypothetical protein